MKPGPQCDRQPLRHDPVPLPARMKRIGRNPARRIDEEDIPVVLPVVGFHQGPQRLWMGAAKSAEGDDLGVRAASEYLVEETAVFRRVVFRRSSSVVRPVVDEDNRRLGRDGRP